MADGRQARYESPPASDANLDNLAWCLLEARRATLGRRIGLWSQMARYVPSVLTRLHDSERERDLLAESWRTLAERRNRLMRMAQQAAADGEAMRPEQVIACLNGREE